MKKRNAFNETAYKTFIKVYMRQLRVSSKQTNKQAKHHSQKILQLKYDINKRWTVMKEIIGKAKHSKKSNFPQKT